MFKRGSQFCRSAFEGKEGKNVVAWSRERGTKDQRFNSIGQILTAGNAIGEQQKGSESMENLKSLEINLKISKWREEEKQREGDIHCISKRSSRNQFQVSYVP